MPTEVYLTRSRAKLGDLLMVIWYPPVGIPSISIAIVTMQEWFKDITDGKWKWRYFVRFTELPDDIDQWSTDPRSKVYTEDAIMANLTIGKYWMEKFTE